MIWSFLTEHWWLPFLVAIAFGHVTTICVTLYLHRDQTHGGLTIKAPVSIFMRFWLWLNTSINTREWVACHRKHHAFADEPDDPHSPVYKGIFGIIFKGVYYYRQATQNATVIETYGKGTVNDWLEKYFFTKMQYLGVILLLMVDILLFHVWYGFGVWIIQVGWIPFWAAGIVNGVGHYLGYRNFEVNDESRNIMPIGIIMGGEELHNNHHKHPSASKFSERWFEFDIGWMYIRILMFLHLAKVKFSDLSK